MSIPAETEETLQPEDLRVDYEENPTNVDPTTTPQFSWRVATEQRGVNQIAYRLVIGYERHGVTNSRGNVWDSGRVNTDSSTTISYDGPALASDTTYYWSVKVWMDNGDKTEWAQPNQFSTAIRSEDWEGKWIAHQPNGGDTNGWRSRWRGESWNDEEWVQIDLGTRRDLSSISLHPADPAGIIRTPDNTVVTQSWFANPLDGFGFPNAYRIEVSDDAEFEESTLVADVTLSETNGTDESSERTEDGVDVQTHDDLDIRARYVRVTAVDLFEVEPSIQIPYTDFDGENRHVEQVDSWQCFALAALTVHDTDGTVLTDDHPVTASSSVESDTWGTDQLVNGHTESHVASSSPLLRTEFDLDGSVKEARAHVAAVGYGELHVNGQRIGDRQLDPAWTDYEQRVLYASHDLTDQLTEGTNAIGLWLGRGWFSKRHAYWVGDGSPRARFVLTVELEDGRTRTVTSDGNWQTTTSPIVTNDIYDGERYDARREQLGWCTADFEDASWDSATVVDEPGGVLRPQRIEPMRVVETFDVEAVHDHPDGPILDFSQNLTGWLELEIDGADAGEEITLRHAEALTEEGDLSTTDLRTADATDTYVAAGSGTETYEPRFTYHGFRYAQVLDYPNEFEPSQVTAKVVHTAMDRRGEFACSNEDLNQVQHNAVWGLRGNTHSIPEDCPQRDERFGWTGDAQISTRSLLFNFDGARFDEKWSRDHDDVASPMGYVPDVIPNKDQEDPADPTWSVTRVMIPWYLYLHEGNDRILREQYDGMRAYVDYWHSVTEENGIVPSHYGKFGDWLAFENTDGRRGLPHDLFNTAFHYQATKTFGKIAAVVGNETDAQEYENRVAQIADTFNEQFFDEDEAVYGPGTQSSYAVPLFMGIVPTSETDRVVANLVEKVEADGKKLRTGFLGTRPLIHTLVEHGHATLAYEIVSQPEQPGWVYMARNGATTMWERWDSDESVGSGMNSLNHSPFTHISEFFYEALAGIKLNADPITDHVTIAPAIIDDLDWVDASVETRSGELSVAWEQDNSSGYELSVTIPWNGQATIRLPASSGATVTESDNSLTTEDLPDGITSVDRQGGDVVVEAGSGQYEFAISERE